MARLRSPSYPDVTLQQAIDLIGKIYTANRTYPMDREVAAKEMGYSGLTGPSSKRLASLIQFGLLEKHAKNEVRVSTTAESILHPDNAAEKQEGLRAAAFKPQLFSELQERFPDGVPSKSNLESYLLKSGFSDRGVRRAIKAYLGTCEYVEQYEDNESHGDAGCDVTDSIENQRLDGDHDMGTAMHPSAGSSSPPFRQSQTPDLNTINVSVSGGLVRTHEMVLDVDGLGKLKGKIDALLTLVEGEDRDPNSDESQENGGDDDGA